MFRVGLRGLTEARRSFAHEPPEGHASAKRRVRSKKEVLKIVFLRYDIGNRQMIISAREAGFLCVLQDCDSLESLLRNSKFPCRR